MSTIILGVDPGYARTGWGIIKKEKSAISMINYGCIETPAKTSPESRLLILHKSLVNVLKKYRPDIAAVEKLFFNTNAKTAIEVGQARGVVVLTLELAKIGQTSFTPLQVKQAVTGYGNATKDQIQKMVKTLLHLNEVPRPDDAADALAIAITLSATSSVILKS